MKNSENAFKTTDLENIRAVNAALAEDIRMIARELRIPFWIIATFYFLFGLLTGSAAINFVLIS